MSQATQGSFVYDSNGNMVTKTDGTGVTKYIWDYEDKLRQVIKPDGTSINYKYDALGRRSERYIGTASTKFTYDRQDVILDTNSDGTTVKYTNGLSIDDKLMQKVGTTLSYFVKDHLGSTVALTSSTGAITSSASYDSFGNATGTLATRYQYTGREYDADTGLYYYRNRFYDAKLGRFISEDPIGFDGGDFNLFAYVKNNTPNYRDPTGKSPRGVVARIIKTLSPLKVGEKIATKEEAADLIKRGFDVRATNRKTSEEIARAADEFGRKPVHDPPHGPTKDGYMPHHHAFDRPSGYGHVFYSVFGIFAPNIIDLSENACTTNTQFASAIAYDTVSLFDPVGITDVADAYSGLDGGRGGLQGVADYGIDTSPTLTYFQGLKKRY